MISLFSICLFFILLIPVRFLYNLWWIPFRVKNILQSQGLKGPAYKFIHGNTKEIIEMKKQARSSPMDVSSHDIYPRIHPHLYLWMKLYGQNFIMWDGARPQIVVSEPELVKEILINKEGKYGKIKPGRYLNKLLGEGIVIAEGEKWSKLRKLANHAFHGESLKDMVPSMIASVDTMLETWRKYEGKEIDVGEQFRFLTSDVISRTAFGSSYLEGRKVFETLTKLCVIISRNAHKIRYFGIEKLIRSQNDVEADETEQLLHDSIMAIVKMREDEVKAGRADSFGTDFLGSLLKVHHDMDKKNRISVVDLIDECKTFYFAGQETTYSLLCWSILLLAIHTDWQERARKEVLELFGQENPNSEGIARLKTVTMIIYETLRLYSPVVAISRHIHRNVQLGKYELPEGSAKVGNINSMAYLPFGYGPRACVGLNFAANEAKITLSMILQRYKFSLSPNYVHVPFQVLTAQPEKGVQVLLHSL
ncbi:cytochrome P450 CYP749A22-like [Olea europaea subsp. europaea]|uniref:Cytochrome P450 CYP749A22-like n=1 Tax=Olea europaea subsp. europaea TaxID=158383 RepID=A0A8S0QYT8_OLEEU|nr:cytochrome P450 CYP749A22-like [Olea europaea subsp. europaea]